MTDEERKDMKRIWAAREAEDEREAAAAYKESNRIGEIERFLGLEIEAARLEAKERAEMAAQAAADAALDGGK